jgi:hypothetical protein
MIYLLAQAKACGCILPLPGAAALFFIRNLHPYGFLVMLHS